MVALIQILGDCVERLVSYVVVRARLIITIWLLCVFMLQMVSYIVSCLTLFDFSFMLSG